MRNIVLVVMMVSLTGCAGAFSTAVHSLPSIQNCHDVTYIRHGSDVEIKATCQVPMQADPLLKVAP